MLSFFGIQSESAPLLKLSTGSCWEVSFCHTPLLGFYGFQGRVSAELSKDTVISAICIWKIFWTLPSSIHTSVIVVNDHLIDRKSKKLTLLELFWELQDCQDTLKIQFPSQRSGTFFFGMWNYFVNSPPAIFMTRKSHFVGKWVKFLCKVIF